MSWAMRAAASAVRGVLQVHERIERLRDTAASGAPVVFAVGIPDHPEAAAVVQHEQLGDQVYGCMLLEIGREVAKSNAIIGMPNRLFPFRAAAASMQPPIAAHTPVAGAP